MYPSNWGSTHGTSGVVGYSMESVDWRSQLQAELRETSVNYLTDTLKKHLSFSGPEGLQEIERIALSFEENIYTASISQVEDKIEFVPTEADIGGIRRADYIRKITLKRLSIQNPIPVALASNVASNSVNTSDQASEVMQQLNIQGRPYAIHVPSNYTLPELHQQMMSRRMQGLSLDSTARAGNPNGGDWQEEVYQNFGRIQIQDMKNLYLQDLNDMPQKN